jgi:predicted metal-dependent phosphoesterase TrpH
VNIDLHSHSTASDGLLGPADLAARAFNRGVQMLALTDHDDVSALSEAKAEVEKFEICFVPGVEISSCWGGVGVHVLGLAIDPANPVLLQGLKAIRDSRATRALAMGESLAEAGIGGGFEGALAYTGNPSQLSRTHFARFLVGLGHARDVKSVFHRFLVEGKPGYVPHQWAKLADAVGWIRASGGFAVLAHPGRYRLNAEEMRELLAAFRDLGGDGIEVISAAHTPEQQRGYADLAREFGLSGSRGSDFHGPRESKVDLGALPLLPPDLKPVWSNW